MVFASSRFSSSLSVAVARTSQSPFPLAETQKNILHKIDTNYLKTKIWKQVKKTKTLY